MKVKDLLKSHRNWCKFRNEYMGRHCLYGSVAYCYPTTDKQNKALDAVRASIKKLFPDFVPYLRSIVSAGQDGSVRLALITDFNDDPKTTFKDVRKVFLHAKV